MEPDTRRTRYASFVEANESTRTHSGKTEPSDHADLIAEKGVKSLSHYNLVHKPAPIRQAMRILDAKAAVDKEWEELENSPDWQMTNVKSTKKKRSSKKDLEEGGTVHFCYADGLLPLSELGVGAKVPQTQRSCGTPR